MRPLRMVEWVHREPSKQSRRFEIATWIDVAMLIPSKPMMFTFSLMAYIYTRYLIILLYGMTG